MIEFHLNSRSGVPPYQQIVQQVRHALRLGLLGEGDRLPTVKEVVTTLAINPNTVLKAYKELEHSGLVAARPGIGTFVTGTLGDVSARCGDRFVRTSSDGHQGTPGGSRRREHRGAISRVLSIRCFRRNSVR